MAVEGKNTLAFPLSNLFNCFMFIKPLLKIIPVYKHFSWAILMKTSNVKIVLLKLYDVWPHNVYSEHYVILSVSLFK